MELCTEGASFANRDNAIRKLNKVLTQVGLNRDRVGVRWLVAVKADGRFCPVVLLSDDTSRFIFYFASNGISVVS